MKKFVLALGLMAAVSAFAGDFASLQYRYENPTGSAANRQGYQVNFGKDLGSGVTADVFGENLYTNGDGDNTSRIEVGLTPTYNLGNGFTAYGRVATGEKFIPGDRFAYYSVEPGVKYAVNDKLTVKAGYRFREAYDTANGDLTRTWKLGADYAFNKTVSGVVGIDRARGDSNYFGANAGVVFKF